MKRKAMLATLLLLIAAGLLIMSACGGGGGSVGNSGGGGNPPPPAKPTITLTANPTQIDFNGTSVLTWATTNAASVAIDHGIGSNLQPNGSINTPPLTQTTTFTATATGPGGTATATATVTVLPGPLTLTLDPDGPYFSSCGGIIFQSIGFTLNFSDPIDAGSVITNKLFGDQTYQGQPTQSIPYRIGVNCTHLGEQDLQVTRHSDGKKSNVVSAAFVGEQNNGAMDASGNHYELDTQGNEVQVYNGNNPGSQFSAIAFAIAWDNGTGNLVFVTREDGSDKLLAIIGTDGTFLKSLDLPGKGGQGFQVAVLNGVGAVLLTTNKMVVFTDLTANPLAPNTVSIGHMPWSVDLGLVSGNVDGFVTYLEDMTVVRYTNLTTAPTADATLTISGCAKQPGPIAQSVGNYPIATFSSGPTAGKGALICNPEGLVVLFDINTMAQGTTVSFQTFQGTKNWVPVRLTKDVVHGNAVVSLDDRQGHSRIATVSMANGKITVLPNVIDGVVSDLTVAPDGSVIHACRQNPIQCTDISQ